MSFIQVYVNERHFTTFAHRCDVNDAKYIHIKGDVDIADIQYLEPQVGKTWGRVGAGQAVIKGFRHHDRRTIKSRSASKAAH